MALLAFQSIATVVDSMGKHSLPTWLPVICNNADFCPAEQYNLLPLPCPSFPHNFCRATLLETHLQRWRSLFQLRTSSFSCSFAHASFAASYFFADHAWKRWSASACMAASFLLNCSTACAFILEAPPQSHGSTGCLFDMQIVQDCTACVMCRSLCGLHWRCDVRIGCTFSQRIGVAK